MLDFCRIIRHGVNSAHYSVEVNRGLTTYWAFHGTMEECKAFIQQYRAILT